MQIEDSESRPASRIRCKNAAMTWVADKSMIPARFDWYPVLLESS